ncbi:MAG: epoxide hydrolase family protein [Solirubrobacteraceae bacterium]
MSATEATAQDGSVRPFQVDIPDEDLDDLRRRIAATRLPEKEPVEDASQGVQLATMEALARYWATEYDFRRVEARLKAFPHFITEIDGLDIHFIHVRSPHENALPMIITHGWPGSVIELLNVIDPLSNPTAHGASTEDAFHLVVPSIPGYGFSGKPTETGWGPERIGRAWDMLMKRLGYPQYVAQGGDWGAIIVDAMGVRAPEGLLGIHTNMAGSVPPEIWKLFGFGTADPPPPDLSPDEQRAYEELRSEFTEGVGYAVEMALHPQTLYGIADSPVGLAAWMLDHDANSYEDIAHAFVDGQPVGNLTRDEVLDNVTFYWLTNTGVSSGRLYHESKLGFFDAKGVTVPAAVSTFAREIYQVPKSWAERAYPKLIYFNELDKGNHFAAWQEPELFSEEVRAGLRSLR